MTLREQLIRDEELRLKPYTDTTGHLTIGYGFNLDNGIPQFIADALLDYKMNEAIADVMRTLDWSASLDHPRFDALVNLAYNMGIGGLLGFRHMLAALKGGDYEGAASHLLDSTYHEQVGARAERVAQQIRTGAYV